MGPQHRVDDQSSRLRATDGSIGVPSRSLSALLEPAAWGDGVSPRFSLEIVDAAHAA
jgi:hypothetical protein